MAYVEGEETALIRSQNVFDHRFDESGLVFIDGDAARKLALVEVQTDDVLLNITGDGGAIARCCVVPQPVLPARVSQHVVLIRTGSRLIPQYLQRYLSHPAIREYMLNHNSGGSRRALTTGQIQKFLIAVPPVKEQRAIAQVLGALDDKIAANTQIAAVSAGLSRGLFERSLQNGSVESLLSEVTVLISRGVTPAYSEDVVGTTMILNQKCVREQRVSPAASRRTMDSKVRDDKLLVINDVLVNSTGQGTLGRVARWTRNDRATTDSHISIVRFAANLTNPVAAGYGLLRMQETIEELGEGSTGQTELSRGDLGNLRVLLPAREVQDQLAARLTELSRAADAHLAENETLAATRDTLLPQLMSGKLHVKDVEKSLAVVL